MIVRFQGLRGPRGLPGSMRDWDVDNLVNSVQFSEVFGRENADFAFGL